MIWISGNRCPYDLKAVHFIFPADPGYLTARAANTQTGQMTAVCLNIPAAPVPLCLPPPPY